MDSFDFYDIEKLLENGVSDDLLREIVANANRYKVAKECRLSSAFYGNSSLPPLTPNRPSDWDQQLDEFIDSNLGFDGKFKVGQLVMNHHASPDADSWYKQLTGLELKILRGWSVNGRNVYEGEIQWNKNRTTFDEKNLVAIADYPKPWWCGEVINQRTEKLYVTLAPFNNASKTLAELIEFVKNMRPFGTGTLCLYGPRDEQSEFRARFAIEYGKRLAFFANGKRSNRETVLKLMKDIQS